MPITNRKVLFVNLTKQCNINCFRCYLTEESRRNPLRVDEKILKTVCEHDFFSDSELTIIWQGGEAVILGERELTRLVLLAKRSRPAAKQRLITNLFKLEDWTIRLAKKYFDSSIETTFALGGKVSLSGSEDLYLSNFIKYARKAHDAGVRVNVNIEMNNQTISIGQAKLLDTLRSAKVKDVFFDVSVDFYSYLKNPVYNNYFSPILPLTTSYKELADYMIKLVRDHKDDLSELNLLDSIATIFNLDEDSGGEFNVEMGGSFITLNPDGSVTTNPLYSDLTGTFLGNLSTGSTLSECLMSERRVGIIDFHRKRVDEAGCRDCRYFMECGGGSSHVDVFDGSGECVGLKTFRDFIANSDAEKTKS